MCTVFLLKISFFFSEKGGWRGVGEGASAHTVTLYLILYSLFKILN